MKKIISFSLIILIIVGMLINTSYAQTYTYETNLSSKSNELNKDETFIVNVRISNIQAEKGLIVLGGILSYEKDALEIENNSKLEMQEIGEWKGLRYNSANGKFVIDRERLCNRK